ncbi:TPA: FMN reductase, partial [Burkholderia cepacia]
MATELQPDSERRIDIVALCGSLRAQSYNAALLDAAARVAPP